MPIHSWVLYLLKPKCAKNSRQTRLRMIITLTPGRNVCQLCHTAPETDPAADASPDGHARVPEQAPHRLDRGRRVRLGVNVIDIRVTPF